MSDDKKTFLIPIDAVLNITRTGKSPIGFTRVDKASTSPVDGAQQWLKEKAEQGHEIHILADGFSRPLANMLLKNNRWNMVHHDIVTTHKRAGAYDYAFPEHVDWNNDPTMAQDEVKETEDVDSEQEEG